MSIEHEQQADYDYDDEGYAPLPECEDSTSGSYASDVASTAAKAIAAPPKTLSPPFVALFDGMRRALRGLPEHLVASLKRLPPVGTLPYPWVVWLLLSIFVRRQRQAWGRRILEDFMPEAIPPCDAFYDLDSPVVQQLPEHPDWEVSIEVGEPQWTVLTNHTTNENVFVDVSEEGDRGVLLLDFWIETRRGDPEIDLASRRLLELYPLPKEMSFRENWRTIPLVDQFNHGDIEAVFELAENGLIEGGEYGKFGPVPEGQLPDYYLPGDSLIEHEDLALEFLAHWSDPKTQLWCSALIGDWLKAHELALEAGNEDLILVTAPRAAECRNVLIRQVLGPDGDRYVHWQGYLILYNSQADELDTCIQRGLDGDDSAQSEVARFLNLSGAPQWCESVYERWSRGMLSNEILPDGFPMYLLRHSYRTDDVTDIIASKTDQTR